MPSCRRIERFAWGFVACLIPCFASAATVPATVHPNWTKLGLRPDTNFRPQVSGMAFQSDGKLVIAHWNASRNLSGHTNQISPRTFNGRVYLLGGVLGDAPNVSVDTLATGLEDVMGLTLVHDTIYVSGGNVIVRLVRAGGLSGPVTRRDTVFILPGTPVGSDSLKPDRGRQEYLNGLLHAGGKFYVAPSSLDPSVTGTAQANPYRGEYLEVTPGDGFANKRGAFRRVASGLRAPSGIGFGPDGLHCVSDNQGEWLPGNKLQCVKEGMHYGFQKTAANNYYAPFNSQAYVPPTAWVVQDEVGNSPTAPLYVPSGPYAGQMLMGDARWGTGINRYFIERNGSGDLQAAVFLFTGGLESGAFRMAWGPDGHLYVGQLGGRDDGDGFPKNQATAARVDYGLAKLRYNDGTPAFEMLAVRARPAGFEIEFTLPVDTAVAKLTSSYTVQSYHMAPASGYGAGAKQSSSTLTPSGILISPDRLKVYLGLAGIPVSTPTQQRVVYIRLNSYKAASGASPWATEAWYTLNGAGTGAPFDPPIPLEPPVAVSPGPADVAGSAARLRVVAGEGFLRVRIPGAGYREIRVLDAAGRLLRTERIALREAGWSLVPAAGVHGVVWIEIRGTAGRMARAVVLP